MEVWVGPEVSELEDEPFLRCKALWSREDYSRYGNMVLIPAVPPVSTRTSLLMGSKLAG